MYKFVIACPELVKCKHNTVRRCLIGVKSVKDFDENGVGHDGVHDPLKKAPGYDTLERHVSILKLFVGGPGAIQLLHRVRTRARQPMRVI